MMQRLIAFGRRHGRNYISGSSLSSSSSSSSSSLKKVFFSNFNLIPCQSSSSSCNSDSKDYFHIVMNILSNSAPSRRGHQIYTALDAALDVTTLIQQQQHFALKVIETSCQTKLVHTPRVPPYDLIRFIKLVWKNNKDLITTPVVESLVSSICCCSSSSSSSSSSTVSTQLPTKNDILLLWDFLNQIARYHPPGLLNARILNTLIQFFSIMGGRGEGKAALEVFNKFEDFHCVPNHDTYYFTLQALLNTSCCSPDMIHQAASICQNMLLLFPHDHHDGSSSYDQEYTQPPPSPDDSDSDFQIALTFLGGIPRPYLEGCVCANLNLMDFNPLRQQLHHFLLKTIETSSQTKLIETRKVSPHNLIHFVKWAWRTSNNNKDLITTPVLESLVSAICDGSTDIYDVHLRKNDILFLWDLLKHIGHCHTGLLNTRTLNQLLHSFGFMFDQGKTALEVFHKFEVFQCVPNRDTYTFTLQALLSTRLNMPHQAASICQKMLLHPETLLPDDGELLRNILSWFSQNNMTEEAYALYLAANEKRKTNPNWSLRVDMLLPLDMIRVLCSKKETVHLAVEMLNDIPEELKDNGDFNFLSKQRLFIHVANALIGFKELEAAKQLILKPIANSQHPSMYVINIVITALVKAGEMRQVLEMVMLLESIGFDIFEPLMFGFERSNGMLQIRKILEEAKKKDYKLITALLYHTLIVGYCKLKKFDAALKLLTQMKDFGFSDTNLDEYHKLIHSVCLMAMDAKIAIEQLEEMEPMDREMVEEQLSKMGAMDLDMIEEQLEEMYINIRELF